MKYMKYSVKWILPAGVIMLMLSAGLDGSASMRPGNTLAIGEIIPSVLFIGGIVMIMLSGVIRWFEK
jgi:hypothetical protein